jgi:hypothetical protein
MTRIGFVLLTHSCPEQALRLVRALNVLYDGPPIACHHDFGQCPLDKSLFPGNVSFVVPHLATFWGCFSIVPAALAGLRLLMRQTNPPDWIYLLSGSDYPTQSPDAVQRMLARTQFDAFIDHREITYEGIGVGREQDKATGFNRRSYLRLAYRRYCAVALLRPGRDKPWAIPPVGHSYLYHPWWRTLIPSPFSTEFRCYAGEHWFTVNSKAAEVLLDDAEQTQRLLAHLRGRESPEECFYHSMLGNAPLHLCWDNLRYIHWPAGDAWHPSTLSLEHLPKIRTSGAHFARKIEYGSPLVTELDRLLGVSAKASENITQFC